MTQADVSNLLEVLRACHLCFEIQLDFTGHSDTLWSHLDVQITTQLAQHRLTLPPAPAPSAQSSTTSGFHNLPWIVVQKGRKTGDAHKLAIAGDLDGHGLTLPYLRSTKAFPHPSDKDRLLLLVGMHLIICHAIL